MSEVQRLVLSQDEANALVDGINAADTIRDLLWEWGNGKVGWAPREAHSHPLPDNLVQTPEDPFVSFSMVEECFGCYYDASQAEVERLNWHHLFNIRDRLVLQHNARPSER